MITITSELFYQESRETLVKKIDELRRSIESKMSRLLVFESEELVDFNYCVLRVQLEVISFLEHYLLGKKEKNWLCVSQIKYPVERLDEFVKVIEYTKQMILEKQPTFNIRYNNMYFMVLHFLNKVEVKEDGA